jgi:hypothetical protein
MLKDYIATSILLTLLTIFNNVYADGGSSTSTSSSTGSSTSAGSSSSGATSTTPLTPSVFQQNAGTVIPLIETGVQTYISTAETNNLNYGLHLINFDGTTITTSPQVQFITDYARTSCNSNLNIEQNNIPECTFNPTTGIYTIIKPSNIFNSLNFTDPADPFLNASFGVIRSLIEPFPNTQLNTLLTNFSANETDIANLIAAQAPLTIAKNSLNGIMARRLNPTVIDSLNPTPTPPAQNIASQLPSSYNSFSIMQIMHDESFRRLTDPNWFSNLNNLPVSQLLMELLEVEAFKLWMEYNKFQQNERIEALLATLVSSQAGQANAMSGVLDQDTVNSMKDAKNKSKQLQNSTTQYQNLTPGATPSQ